jgi:predicted DNA-binding transcriptional regulator YafY
MASNHDTLLRQWQMLRLIPRYPQKVTASALKSKLDAESLIVSKRTIERDLIELSAAFPLTVDDRSKPHGWSWQKDAPAFDLPGLGNNEALAIAMVEQYLQSMLPSSTLDSLAPYFSAARQHLSAIPQSGHVRTWLNKVRSVPPSQPLLSPPIDPEVQRTVSEALLLDRQLQVQYRRRGDATSVNYRVHPLALVQRGGLFYLHVRIFDYEDTRSLVMHRIEQASMLNESAKCPAGFSVDEEIARGRFGFGEGNMVNVRLRFQAEYGAHLYETPLSPDQHIEEHVDERLTISATVAETPQLFWWILGFGSGVEVLEPPSLRKAVADTAKDMANLYNAT